MNDEAIVTSYRIDQYCLGIINDVQAAMSAQSARKGNPKNYKKVFDPTPTGGNPSMNDRALLVGLLKLSPLVSL